MNPTRVVAWDDGGAGGIFGRLENNIFYPESDPTRINAYKPPLAVGIYRIRVQADDIPQATEPGTGRLVTTYDDPPVWSDFVRYTVWEFEIDPHFVDALPQDGASYTFTATIRPTVDHNGASMGAYITFGLNSSAEPGYCMNATRTPDEALTTCRLFRVSRQ